MLATIPALPHAASGTEAEATFFVKRLEEAERVFREEQNAITERLFKKQRKVLAQVLQHESAQLHTPSRSSLSLVTLQAPSASERSRCHHVQKEDSETLFRNCVDTNDTRELEARTHLQTRLLSMTSSYKFEIVTAVLVALYSTVIGIQVHVEMARLLGTESHVPDWVVARIDTVVLVLVVAYIIEVIMRMVAEQRDFFHGNQQRWNIFDSVILLISVVDVIVSKLPDHGAFQVLSRFRVLRTLRFFRNLRIIVFFKCFTDLRVMLWSIVCCLQSFLWAMLLLVIFFYFVTIFLEDSAMVMLKRMLDEQDMLGSNVSKGLDENINAIKSGLTQHWDGLLQGILSLIFAISGGDDWANIGKPFFQLNSFYGVFFAMIVLISLFGVLNVLIGIFVQKASGIEVWDRELALMATDLHHQSQNETYKKLFQEIDADSSGSICLTELRHRLSGPNSDQRIQNYFRHLGIDIDTAAHEILVALDSNGDGVLSLDEFVKGCRKLQGVAKPAQLEQIMLKIDNIQRLLDCRAMHVQSSRTGHLDVGP